MKNKVLLAGIVLLSAFVLFGVWKVFLHERNPFQSYAGEAEGIVGFALDIMERNAPPRTKAEVLKRDAVELRNRYGALTRRASDEDNRRPSCRKLDDVVTEIENAARDPGSALIVETRFGNAKRRIDEVKSLLGSREDQPQ